MCEPMHPHFCAAMLTEISGEGRPTRGQEFPGNEVAKGELKAVLPPETEMGKRDRMEKKRKKMAGIRKSKQVVGM